MPWPAVIRFSWPGRHQLPAAHAVAMQHLAGDQPTDRLQPGVRMRRHLHAGRAADVVGPVVVDEAPGSDHPAGPVGQRSGDRHGPRTTERDRSAIHQLAHRLHRHACPPATGGLPGATFQVAHAPTLVAPVTNDCSCSLRTGGVRHRQSAPDPRSSQAEAIDASTRLDSATRVVVAAVRAYARHVAVCGLRSTQGAA